MSDDPFAGLSDGPSSDTCEASELKDAGPQLPASTDEGTAEDCDTSSEDSSRDRTPLKVKVKNTASIVVEKVSSKTRHFVEHVSHGFSRTDGQDPEEILGQVGPVESTIGMMSKRDEQLLDGLRSGRKPARLDDEAETVERPRGHAPRRADAESTLRNSSSAQPSRAAASSYSTNATPSISRTPPKAYVSSQGTSNQGTSSQGGRQTGSSEDWKIGLSQHLIDAYSSKIPKKKEEVEFRWD